MLEKNYVEGCSSEDAEKLAVKALLDIVESGAKSIEMAVSARWILPLLVHVCVLVSQGRCSKLRVLGLDTTHSLWVPFGQSVFSVSEVANIPLTPIPLLAGDASRYWHGYGLRRPHCGTRSTD